MKRYLQVNTTCPARYFSPGYAETLFQRLKQVLYIDRGSFWGNRGDAEDDGIDPHSLLYSDDIAHPWQDGGYREIRWMPSFDPYDDYEYKQWGSMTFEEFLAYFNITVTEKYPECVA